MPDVRQFVDMDKVAGRMTPGLRKAVSKAGWPSDLAASMSVGHTSGVLGPRFTGSEKQFQQVQDLEFGTYKTPPTGALFNHFTSNDTQKQIADETRRAMDHVARRIDRLFK